MQSAAQAYRAVAKQVASPRDLEADLLLKAASKLQAVQDSWENGKPKLNDALLYNRKLWTHFMATITEPKNPLPVEIRQNVANLGLFTFQQTFSLLANPRPEPLSSLIGINRQLAAGLRGGA